MPIQNTTHVSWQKVSIVINGIRYPSQVEAQIRYHINGSYLKQYLQAKHGWSDKVWKTIDMHAFGHHFKSLAPAMKIHQMKFIHDLLSVGQRKGMVSNAQGSEVTLCPCCRAATETTFHLLQCTSNAGRSKAIEAFKKNTTIKEANRFGKVFVDVVIQWLNDPQITPSPEGRMDTNINYDYYPAGYINLLRTAIQSQTQIGWLNLMKGYLSTKWHELASTDFSFPEDEPTNRDDGSPRISKAIRAFHTFTHTLWTARNDALHRNQEENTRHQRTVLDAEIAKYHADTAALPAADQHYCDIRLDALLRRSPSYKRRWIYRVRRAREMFKIIGESNQTRLPKYFRRIHSTKTSDQDGQSSNTSGDNSDTPTAFPTDQLPPSTPRTHTQRPIVTTQQLITRYLRERASNSSQNPHPTSPPPR